ncbi:MAG: polyprenyl synthetase family protein [Acidimicrobiales bacterium]|nr:polyprenyl synthetase family protein [Acidimicrobiales bacterium]
MTTAPAALTTVAGPVEHRLDAALAAESARWTAIDPNLQPFLDTLHDLVLGGGKRLRPAFCYWGHQAAGGPADDPRVVDAGAALELLHAFALAHDDVMDGSTTRRSSATIHERWAKRHADAGWRGESRRFGEGVAILVGDLAHVIADHLIVLAAPGAAELWRDLRSEVNLGQLLDVLSTARSSTDRDLATRIARYKSGLYTVERPLALGAHIAGEDALGQRLATYGQPVGEAFQLRDDILGAFGDSEVVGKPVGDDLREGKPTLLLAIASERATATQAAVLSTIGTTLSATDIALVQQVLIDTGALDAVEAGIEQRTHAGLAALDELDLPAEADTALRELAVFVSSRRH